MDQIGIPCEVYRGGTSRGLFFFKDDLPYEFDQLQRILTYIMGTPEAGQIDGLGNGTSHGSKVAVISKSKSLDADIDYHFIQVDIRKPIIDDSGTCGNLIAAVGCFAVDKGLVKPQGEKTTVRVRNTNNNSFIDITLKTDENSCITQGKYQMPGITKTGSPIKIMIKNPGGGILGKTLPLGEITTYENFQISLVDAVNPVVFLNAKDFNLSGIEDIKTLDKKNILNKLEDIRDELSCRAKLAKNKDEAKNKYPAIPKIALVGEPKDFKTSSGNIIKSDDYDISIRMVSMNRWHNTAAVSALYCLAAATRLNNTIPNKICRNKGKAAVRIAHPEGITEIEVNVENGHINYLGMMRTARRIASGVVYIPKNIIGNEDG